MRFSSADCPQPPFVGATGHQALIDKMTSRFDNLMLHKPIAAANRRRAPRPPDLGALPRMESRGSLRRHGLAGVRRATSKRASRGQAFADAYQGKLAHSLRSPRGRARSPRRSGATRRSQDLIGRLMSYASLLHAGDTADPALAKFYGDAQERMTDLAGDLLFFELELNRLDDAELERAMATRRARALSPVDRGHPQGEAASARGSRSSNCFSKSR